MSARNQRTNFSRTFAPVISELDVELKQIVCISDFISKLDELRAAEGKSNWPTALSQLIEMFKIIGVVCEPGKSYAYYEELVYSSGIPSEMEMYAKFLLTMYNMSGRFKSPEEHMLDIVNRQSCPQDGWSEDSLRMRILKQFIKYGNYLYDVVTPKGRQNKHLVGGKHFIESFVGKKLKKKKVTVDEVLEHLDEDVFTEYILAVEKARAELAAVRDMRDSVKKEVGQLESRLKKSDGAQRESAEGKALLDLVSQKKEQAAVLGKEAGKKDERLKTLRKLNSPYGLLKICDDLASGRFREKGSTKRMLYLFAMVFHMTYCVVRDGDRIPDSFEQLTREIPDYESDVEKNLFFEYYTNNLFRFISRTCRSDGTSCEWDPPGQGINYKNFAEIVFLYYIHMDIEPIEKIRRSTEMINRIRSTTPPSGSGETGGGDTEFYRSYYMPGVDGNVRLWRNDFVMNLDEEAFFQFIIGNYRYSKDVVRPGGSIIDIESEQVSAYNNYCALVEGLVHLCGDLPNEYGYGFHILELYGGDREKCKKTMYRDVSALDPTVDREKFGDFVELLFRLNYFLTQNDKDVDSATITRSRLISAYYYYYNAKAMKVKKLAAASFSDMFKYYKRELDQYLAESNYQELNGKNIFDVLAVFSSYAYLKWRLRKKGKTDDI